MMNRIYKIFWLLVTMLLLFASTLWASMDTSNGEQTSSAFLADMHKAKAIDCASCHGEKTIVDDNETVVNAKCVECHGSLATLAEKSKDEINPHKSHLGAISCTACHHGHTASWTYCLSCHGFDLKIPAGTVAAELPAVALPKVNRFRRTYGLTRPTSWLSEQGPPASPRPSPLMTKGQRSSSWRRCPSRGATASSPPAG
ncbi:MAG TPA: cytochrome c3 family protein [Nitrospirota bacterium]|nr:cytochrome c3 family protein [Nitrospirota bacterium]